ncbi:ABC transporter ATP-binding protein [Pseudoprimorskyibacter insulae]|uniref:Spermidine/putrescine import ATP-binding protein PotA n=1 Tax=Pseudoprimorskyibacter insulae TaxID=1695997 RepID=A0A2R8ATE1_9RHOB|nr:ABC transporter ATP-binding protein [Pseudoprimorskyibacter insulae]SPF79333.1 Spermidine/putrescine import ATP-binding protein PotA [Pseudoprimorskyibacter insulae]
MASAPRSSGIKHASTAFAPWEDPDAKPLIQFKNVTKKFGDFTAIDDLTIDIYQREFFALLGPSGCGKTTLMRMLAGFENPTRGQILLGGQDIVAVPPNKRPVNMMFQSYALFPHLSVWDNIAFGLRRDKLDQDKIEERVAEMLRLTRLEQFAKRKPHQISGGQRQRVALARSLAKAPKLLLLDEPLGALDKKLRNETQFELMDIQEKTGTTFVIVTHDQEEAMTVASRVAVMDHGKMIQVDTPAGIYEAPNSVYVADFIGDVNIVEGNATVQGDRVHISFAEGADPIITAFDQPISDGQRVSYAIRPEKISVDREPLADRANHVRGKIEDIGYLGDVSTYHVRLPSGGLISALMTNSRRLARRDFTWDDEVWLSWTDTAGVLLTK